VVGIKTATDPLGARRTAQRRIVPDRDAKIFPMGFPGWATRCARQDQRRDLRRAVLFGGDRPGRLRRLFTAVEAVGYDHELLDIWFGDRFLKANPEAVRTFLADYVAVTKYYLANTAQAKSDLHKSGFVRTPLEIYLRNADWKRDPDGARRRRQPRETFQVHAREAAVARESRKESELSYDPG